MYQKYIKRIIDIICSLLALIIFCWLYLVIAVLVRINLGKPVIFKQPRPGKVGKNGKEKIFILYKFRTMTNTKDKNGNLLPNNQRLTKFGAKLRDWSLDELPEALNILKGDMSVIGPRPQLVHDMVFMTAEQRHRHDVKPGLSGLAQVSGRNSINWEEKINIDLQYIKKITFWGDVKIGVKTIIKVFKREGISVKGQSIVDDFGDALLKNGKISNDEYDKKQKEAIEILKQMEK